MEVQEVRSIFCRLVEVESGTYIDGELRGLKRLVVVWHLAHCVACRSDIVALSSLSTLLQSTPVEAHTPPWVFLNRLKGNIAWERVRGRRKVLVSPKLRLYRQELSPLVSLICSLPCLAAAFSSSGIVLALAAAGLAGASVIEYTQLNLQGVL